MIEKIAQELIQAAAQAQHVADYILGRNATA
jgi:hypothetical protein